MDADFLNCPCCFSGSEAVYGEINYRRLRQLIEDIEEDIRQLYDEIVKYHRLGEVDKAIKCTEDLIDKEYVLEVMNSGLIGYRCFEDLDLCSTVLQCK